VPFAAAAHLTMGNTIGFNSRPRFKIKNKTEFPIFVKLTLEKSQSLEVENIQPGKRVSDL